MEKHDCNFHDALKVCINSCCPLHKAMRRLAANLAIGAALCKSFVIALDGCDLHYYEQAISGIDDCQSTPLK